MLTWAAVRRAGLGVYFLFEHINIKYSRQGVYKLLDLISCLEKKKPKNILLPNSTI